MNQNIFVINLLSKKQSPVDSLQNNCSEKFCKIHRKKVKQEFFSNKDACYRSTSLSKGLAPVFSS